VSCAAQRSATQPSAAQFKMAAVLDECTLEEQRAVVRFLWAKGHPAKVIHKEMSCLW
jgi:hypothetical protein